MHVNDREVDLMYDSMMSILWVRLPFVESFGGDGMVMPFVRLPSNVGDGFLLSTVKYTTDRIHGRFLFEIVVGCLNSSDTPGEVSVMTLRHYCLQPLLRNFKIFIIFACNWLNLNRL